ncbi:hypothetical protein P167DRAFT_565390 [Morchella conica CCBAS932]|uniref:Uncharacterized protein n=1 Tax=Morchella conica CCBAS932 TaxID=1392247 RepID=A0A3N4KSI6_9PEZI|nr:hypothetical protein P167DRAFT_565390 [Morchella conica CCBAS932]
MLRVFAGYHACPIYLVTISLSPKHTTLVIPNPLKKTIIAGRRHYYHKVRPPEGRPKAPCLRLAIQAAYRSCPWPLTKQRTNTRLRMAIGCMQPNPRSDDGDGRVFADVAQVRFAYMTASWAESLSREPWVGDDCGSGGGGGGVGCSNSSSAT